MTYYIWLCEIILAKKGGIGLSRRSRELLKFQKYLRNRMKGIQGLHRQRTIRISSEQYLHTHNKANIDSDLIKTMIMLKE